jgi:hypothetical protein
MGMQEALHGLGMRAEWPTSGSPLLGAGSNCRNFLLICSSTSIMAAMLPAMHDRWLAAASGLFVQQW